MSDLQKIKDRLINEEKIEEVLTAIGCEYVKPEQRGHLITAQLPERFYSTNKRSVQVRVNDSLSCFIRSRANGFSGDIFNLVSYLQFDVDVSEVQDDLSNAKEFICNLFGWQHYLKGHGHFRDVITKKDYTASMKAILKGKKKQLEIRPNPIIPEEAMDEFYYDGYPIVYQGWIDEGISATTQEVYGVGFDLDSKRVVFPLRNRFGKLVGVKGRIMKDSDDPERKYLYIYRCNNRYEWFNWYIAHPYILEKKRVYIFESEKSSMKAFEYGIYNALSIGASDITPEQAQMIKQLGLDVEIVLCYDKGISLDDIRKQAKIFDGRQVMAVFDTDNIIEGKNAPIDQGLDTWNKLVDDYIFEVKQKK